MQMVIKFLRRLKMKGIYMVRFLDLLRKLKLLKQLMRAFTQLQFKQFNPSDLLKGAKFNNTSRNNWKPLFDVNFSRNSTKTIRL